MTKRDPMLTLIATTIVLGFGWLAIRGFVELPVFVALSPLWKVLVGVIGSVITVKLFKRVFHVNIKGR